MFKDFLFVFLGGGVGCSLRYAIQCVLKGYTCPMGFPLPTFLANIGGCFLIGMFYALSARFNLPQETRLLLTTGLCGGFTTFSTFSNESLTLLRQSSYTVFALYVCGSMILGILAVIAGNIIVGKP